MKRSNLENIFLMELKKAGGRLEDSLVADKIFSYLKTVDINAYIHYLEEEYDWISYFRHKRFTCQKYGYFVWGRDWKQILFQFIRPCRFLTIRLYKVTLSQPKSFFNHHYEWEKQNLLENMIPRCREVLEHLDEYKTIYGQLSDDESKRCFLYVIMGYLTLKYDYFHKAKHSGEKIDYYPEDIFHRLPQVIVDCGSYIGDTALQYLKYFGDRISSIYLFEPDEKNMKKAQEDLAFGSKIIMFVQAAVSDDDGIMSDGTLWEAQAAR